MTQREDSTKHDQDELEHYPSNRDGIFGFILQLADEQGQPSFIRHRGDAVNIT